MFFCPVSSSWTHLGATELIGTDRLYPCVVDILDTAPLMDGCVTAVVVVSALIVVLGIDLVKEALWDTAVLAGAYFVPHGRDYPDR